MEREEAHRSKWALGLATTLSVFILVGFGFYKGFLTVGNSGVIAQNEQSKEVATVIVAEKAPSPLSNSKQTFSNILDQITDQYSQFKDSINSVLVPFVTGIEVYERD